MMCDSPPIQTAPRCECPFSQNIGKDRLTDRASDRIIRMSNFRDIIRLSAEWNGACYVDEDMKKFFDGVVDLILSIT